MLKSKVDGLKIQSPSEIIIFNDIDELNDFLEKNKNISSDNYKLIGNMMIKNHFYEKAIFYYKKALDLNCAKNDKDIEIILYSNLSEAYIKYGYNTKSIEYADICLNKINKAIEIDTKKEKEKFLSLQKIKNVFRKIKALTNLRKFKDAYEIIFNTSNDNPNKDILKKMLNMDIVKKLVDIIKIGYDNNNGNYNYIKMIQEEKINFNLDTYEDYMSPKIEIKFEKNKGIKIVAKEKINEGELIMVEKALVSSEDKKEKNMIKYKMQLMIILH